MNGIMAGPVAQNLNFVVQYSDDHVIKPILLTETDDASGCLQTIRRMEIAV